MTVNYKKELEQAAKNMIMVHEPDLLIKLIGRTIVQKAKASHVGILLHDREKDTYILKVSRGPSGKKVPAGFTRMDKNNPLVRLFKERQAKRLFNTDALVVRNAKQLLQEGSISEQDRALLTQTLYQLELFDTTAAIPSFYRDELLGFLLLGDKITQQDFGQDEIDFFIALASDVAMGIRNAQLFQELESELTRNKRLFFHTTIALAAAIEAKDRYTHGHTSRVTTICLEIARKLQEEGKLACDDKFLEQLHVAGLLHDIGKIGIPEAILNKEGPLSEEEWVKMKQHPVIGTNIISPIHELKDSAIGVKYHHEKFDGTGYPEGLEGNKIPIMAAIISVADAFDAMTTERPYRKALTKEEAAQEIERLSGSQFEPEIAKIFLKLYRQGDI